MTSPLVVPIAEALYATPDGDPWPDNPLADDLARLLGMWADGPHDWLAEATAAADACIAVIAALPADYTAVDVLAHLRGDDVPSEPLPVVAAASGLRFEGDEMVVDYRDPSRHAFPHITCADGFRLSVQASQYHYCAPREDVDRYVTVEVGYPTERPEPWADWVDHCEDPDSPTSTVYGHVPARVVRDLIAAHGGAA